MCVLALKISYLDQEGDSDENGKDEHAAQAIKMKCPAARAVHQGDGNERHDDHDQADTDGSILGIRLCHPSSDEKVGRVVEYLPKQKHMNFIQKKIICQIQSSLYLRR